MKQSQPMDLDQQFMQGMDDISIATESDFEDPADDPRSEELEREQRRKALERNQLILQELKNGVNMDNALISEFQQGFHGIVEVTRGQKDTVMSPQVVQEIKRKVSKEAPQIVLAEETILPPPKPSPEPPSRKPAIAKEQLKDECKEQSRLRQKMDAMFQDRELIDMARCDRESMKYEQDFHSDLLSMRFFTPSVRTVQSAVKPIYVVCPEPAYTYTNLQPQINNEGNVLSKHSKVLAFRALGALIRPRMMPVKAEALQITFTRMELQSKENPQQSLLVVDKTASAVKPSQIQLQLKEHYASLATTIGKLEQVSRNYQPKLLKEHLETHEKGLNADIYDGDETSEKTLDRFIETMQNPSRAKELLVTFEKLGSLRGIDQLPSIQYASLQFNCLTKVDEMVANFRLIEINLSHNKISQYEPLSKLKWLRSVDLEHNEITQMCPLEAEHLEVLVLKHNKISEISGLESSRNLRRLNLSHNNLKQISGLDSLCFLDELRISNNKIGRLSGIDRCLLLCKLDVSSNKITAMDRLIMMFLNEIDLRNNQLEQLESMIMPSLQTLYLTDNRLSTVDMKAHAYLPNLRLLNLDHNKLTGYAPVWHLIAHSTKLSIVKYDDNEELSLLPDKVRELYEHMLYRRRHQLTILNQSEYSIGLKRYYQSLYEQLLEDNTTAQLQSASIRNIEAKIELTLQENRLLSELEASKDPFSRQPEFVWLKSVKVADNLLQIQKGLSQASLQLNGCNSVFYRLDCFRMRYERSLHKLRSLLVRWKYRRARRAKYFLKNRATIQKQLGWMTSVLWRLDLLWAVTKFRQMLAFGVGHKQAIKIQKVWRGYIVRKRFRKVMNRIRMPSTEDDYLEEEIDLDFFENPIDFNIQLKVPENFNFGNLVIRPQVFKQVEKKLPQIRVGKLPEVANNSAGKDKLAQSSTSLHSQSSRTDSKRDTVELPRINMQRVQPPPLPPRRQIDEQAIMEEWGFKNPETVALMRKKAEKKRKTMEKEMEKNMTAAQRLERFKRL